MIETIVNKGTYPKFQAEGFAARFAFPFAQELCKGYGLDIGCGKKEWCLPGANPIDPALAKDGYDAMNFPGWDWDYIFSSHCLEHIPNWVEVLDYWHTKLKPGGVLFLYLPDMNHQQYWRPWHNRKHVNYFTPAIFRQYFQDMDSMWRKAFVSEADLNCSFYAVAEKLL